MCNITRPFVVNIFVKTSGGHHSLFVSHFQQCRGFVSLMYFIFPDFFLDAADFTESFYHIKKCVYKKYTYCNYSNITKLSKPQTLNHKRKCNLKKRFLVIEKPTSEINLGITLKVPYLQINWSKFK
jgi:hypothetical protein